MRKIGLFAALFMAVSTATNAGGLLTNTNQNITFLRNPAREGAIGIDGVYSNPAGVAFLKEGFHLSLNWQNASQTRTVVATNPLFALGLKNNGSNVKEYVGEAKAPVIPSLQVAYNKGKWAYQFGFAIAGGGGKCEYANGVGSFESIVGQIAYGLGTNQGLNQLKSMGVNIPLVKGYDNDGYMQGRQYYYGFTLGAAYKVNDNFSVYGGLRALYGSASYKAKIENLKAICDDGNAYTLNDYFTAVQTGIQTVAGQISGAIEGAVQQGMAAGLTKEQVMASPTVQALQAKATALQGAAQQLQANGSALSQYSNGVNMQSDQTGFGVAPIIGFDYKTEKFNVGMKYEFRTRIAMKNKSTVTEANEMIPIINEYVDGTSIREDQPALLTVGAEWKALPILRVNVGYHHFFDEESKKYGNEQDKLSHGTNEYLAGVEVDVHKRVTLSCGAQLTRYGLTDEFMNDMKFVTNSYSLGAGAAIKLSEKTTLNVAYFKTFYDHYKTAASSTGLCNDFTRTNKVFGVGVDIDL